ncbi:MAG: IS1595 family transposase [Acidobacteriia bacterium]|nr:IS1595 family transposase [Terriglobia bacterium]
MKNEGVREPKTLQEAVIYFSDADNCLAYMVKHRWPGGVVCPTCGRTDATFLKNQRKWQCRSHHATRQFSAKTGTIFEDSPLGLDKWLTATWMITNCKNGISSYEIARDLGVTQKTAWFMLHRIRKAMQTGSFQRKLAGHVEADETFIGGKARFMHKDKRERINRRGFGGKTVVVGVLERGGHVRTEVAPDRERNTLHMVVKQHVAPGSHLSTDDCKGYWGLYGDYIHQIIDHAETYVSGKVHTNGMENFWSLLKRGLKGTYVSVEPFHLFRYLDEQMFRYNNRATQKHFVSDSDRFQMVASQFAGKRLTYQELTGKGMEKPRPEAV